MVDKLQGKAGGLLWSCRPRLSVRGFLIQIAVVAIILALFQRWDFHRRGPISEKLLRPIIEHFDQATEGHARMGFNGLDLAQYRTKPFARRALPWISTLLYTGVVCPLSFPEATIRQIVALSQLTDLRSEFIDQIVTRHKDSGPSVLENYTGAIFSFRMAHHTSRMAEYFRTLLAEHWTTVPPLPPDLESERRALESIMRQTSGDLELEFNEPPWNLIPGAPRPKWRPKWSTGDSF